MGIEVTAYKKQDQALWDRLVDASRNSTFILNRNYLDYHSERFIDSSLIVRLDDQPLALFPASQHGLEIRSHGGLTYGGLIYDHRMDTLLAARTFREIFSYYLAAKMDVLVYKPAPYIYHAIPSEEDLYSLFIAGAELCAQGPSAAIDMKRGLPGKKLRGSRKGQSLGLSVHQVKDAEDLMGMIDDNLQKKYGVSAVHNAKEMNLLLERFKENIHIYHLNNSFGALMGGAIVYVSNRVAHVQYMVVSEQARTMRGMDVLISKLVEVYGEFCEYLDFGISSEDNGRKLNVGLCKQKEEFGASTVCYSSYRMSLKSAFDNIQIFLKNTHIEI